ncbi:syntaxin-binding protein 3 [Microcaecilia unicolor]|uniref:Syntaxin-binding protein 3 n=1 Tax=Microcaecilia unicolor TaxID=1415580 RepID=A0A6P7YGP0_9AMPH|nr:syntaxin-binding protein 3 [Microcaecilia unicolor]
MAPAELRGLKGVVWKKIKSAILDDCKKEDEWKVLLLDHFTTKLLSSCCKMADLLAEGISVVEDVHKNHEPVPHLKAVYFITPTEQSVDGLIRDFKDKSSYKYKAAYVYFSDFCPDILFNKLKSSCAKAIKRCKEINVSFIPQESHAFTLHIPDVFHSCYSPNVEIETVLNIAAEQIVTLCCTLDENPGVRYKKQPLDNANALANLVEEKLVHYYKTDEEGKVKGKTQTQLLIVDRGFDPVSTVLHELTFQAMTYDLLPIEKDTYRYQTDESNKKEKEAYLDEHDELWVKIRHKHIAYVLAEIPRLVKEIASSKKATEGKLSISSLSQLMKKMPHFRKQLSTQTLHLNIAENCMKKFQSHVEKLCKSEQDLALGTDAEGQKVKDFMRVLLPVLLNKSFAGYDKIRAILLYIFSMNGTTQENLDKLIQHAQIVADSDMIENWKYLGVPIISSSASQLRKPARRERSQDDMFQLSRWTPVVKDIMEDAIENKLDAKEWIYCSECPAAWNGSGAVSARQKYKTNMADDRKNEPKLIIFILGGMTYSEMRCAYEVTEAIKSCEVIIGSTHILTPERLLDDMKALSKPKVTQDTFSSYNRI